MLIAIKVINLDQKFNRITKYFTYLPVAATNNLRTCLAIELVLVAISL